MNNANRPNDDKLHQGLDTGPVQSNPPSGPDARDPDERSMMDRSPARQKDRMRDEPRHEPGQTPTDEVDGSGPDEDTYD